MRLLLPGLKSSLYLVEIDYINPATGEVRTIRASSGQQGFQTSPYDLPANAFYRPTLKVPCDYQCSIFQDGITGGCANGGYGVIQLINDKGYYDQYSDMIFDGQQVRVFRGLSDNFRTPIAGKTAFTQIATGVQCGPQFGWRYVYFKIRDYTEYFDKPISSTVYMGNNVGYIGFEGTPSDLMNQSKPLCYGRCWNVSPALISSSWMLYQVHDGPVKAIDSVFIDGTTQTLDTSQGTAGDFATPEALVAVIPAAGKYLTCLARGMFSISGGVSSGVTANVKGDNTGGVYVDTIPGILARIATTRVRLPITNFILRSEAKDHAAWTKTGASIGAGDGTAPISGMGIQSLVATGSGTHLISQLVAKGTGMYCFSEYLKAGTATVVRFKIYDPNAPTNYVAADFDLANGVVSNVTSYGSAVGPQYQATGFITDANIVAQPNGWYRCWLAGQPNATHTATAVSITLLSGGSESYAASGQIVYLGGSMLEVYSSPHRYVATVDTPVTTYDPLDAPHIDQAVFDALAATVPYEVGYYVGPGAGASISDVMSAIANSGGVWWAWDRQARLIAGRFDRIPEGMTPVATYTESFILQDSIERTAGFDSKDGTPAYRIYMASVRNWTQQDKSQISSSLWTANPDWVMWLQKEYRDVRAEDLSVLAAHPFGTELSFTSYMAKQTDAIVEAKRLLALYSKRLDRFTFATKIAYAENVNVGSVIKVIIPRLGLQAGKLLMVVSLIEDHASGRITIGALG